MDPTLYRCHDYKHLADRWRKVARAAGVMVDAWAEADGYELLRLMPYDLAPGESPLVYLSAGIHGDEPASTEALIRWAEANPEALRHCLVLPCLNPWGLTNNSRADSNGTDLNRTFHLDTIEPIRTLKAFVAPYRFAASICLHEDYDAHGLYLYEIEGPTPYWGEELLDTVRPIIPIESRTDVDGRVPTLPGLIREQLEIKKFSEYPESVFLHERHSERSFTFETPSEFGLDVRVRALVTLLEAACHRIIPLSR